jgi:hypothetical protein
LRQPQLPPQAHPPPDDGPAPARESPLLLVTVAKTDNSRFGRCVASLGHVTGASRSAEGRSFSIRVAHSRQ